MPDRSLSDAARAFLEAYNSSDWETLAGGMTADAVYDEVGSGRRAAGREHVVDLLRGWKQTMPDSVGTVTSTLERGDEVALEVTWQGTMTGPWGDTPATGRRQTSRSAMFMRFSGDGVSECRQYFDVLTIFEQLGITPG